MNRSVFKDLHAFKNEFIVNLPHVYEFTINDRVSLPFYSAISLYLFYQLN